MNNEIVNAMEELENWLADPTELGRKPAKIEYTASFEDEDGIKCMIFKFKKSFFGKWLLGVCGGYEDDELEHCGHVFSEMEEYDPATAQEKAIAMVEMIRQYWQKQAQELERELEQVKAELESLKGE